MKNKPAHFTVSELNNGTLVLYVSTCPSGDSPHYAHAYEGSRGIKQLYDDVMELVQNGDTTADWGGCEDDPTAMWGARLNIGSCLVLVEDGICVASRAGEAARELHALVEAGKKAAHDWESLRDARQWASDALESYDAGAYGVSHDDLVRAVGEWAWRSDYAVGGMSSEIFDAHVARIAVELKI